MKKEHPKAQATAGGRITSEERAFWTTGDPTLDFEIAHTTAKAVLEGGKGSMSG